MPLSVYTIGKYINEQLFEIDNLYLPIAHRVHLQIVAYGNGLVRAAFSRSLLVGGDALHLTVGSVEVELKEVALDIPLDFPALLYEEGTGIHAAVS